MQHDRATLYCQYCCDTGWIVATHKETKAMYSFKCGTCKKAEWSKLSALIPFWENKYQNDYIADKPLNLIRVIKNNDI